MTAFPLHRDQATGNACASADLKAFPIVEVILKTQNLPALLSFCST